jgi:hypothetical protein
MGYLLSALITAVPKGDQAELARIARLRAL